MDNEDLMKPMKELDELTRLMKTVGLEAAESKAKLEKLEAETKVILGYAYNKSDEQTVASKERLCHTDPMYLEHLESLDTAKNEHYINFSNITALRHRIEFVRQQIMVVQSLMKIQ